MRPPDRRTSPDDGGKVDSTQLTPEPRRMSRLRKHRPSFDLHGQMYRVTGVDLTEIDGVDLQTAQTVISEVGRDMKPVQEREAVRLLARFVPR